MNPSVPTAIVFGISLFVAETSDYSAYRLWGSSKFLEYALLRDTLILWVVFLSTLVITTHARIRINDDVRFNDRRTRHSFDWMPTAEKIAHRFFIVVILAYAYWMLAAATNGVGVNQLRAVVNLEPGAVSVLKGLSRPIGGITTWVQLAPIVVSLRLMLFLHGNRRRAWQLLLIYLLSVARAFLYGERLALIEVTIPSLLLVAMFCDRSGIRWMRPATFRILPLLLTPLLWVYFAAFEYTRSWQYYKNVTSVSFVSFINNRLLGYYTTSINNSALYFELLHDRPHAPYFSLSAIWDAPFVGTLLGSPTVDGIGFNSWWSQSLKGYANPDFNNYGSFLVTAADLGMIGGSIAWMVGGALLGLAYKSALRGSPSGIVVYVCSFVGVLELPRFIYWTQGRFIPVLVGLTIVAVSFRRLPPVRRVPLEIETLSGSRSSSTPYYCMPSQGRGRSSAHV